MEVVGVVGPERGGEQHQQPAADDLEALAPAQRPQPPIDLLEPAIPEQPEAQGVLLFHPLIEGLPDPFHLIQFHVHAPVSAATWPRSLSFMRLIFVATLVSLMPNISAMSAWL